MAKFMQLDLEGKSPKNSWATDKHTASRAKPKKVMLAGLLMITLVMGVILLGVNGCSKGSSKAEVVSASNQTVSHQQPTPVSTTINSPSTTASAPKQPPAPKKHRKSSAVIYTNREYGIYLQYPRNYVLKTGDAAQLEWTSTEPVAMDFVQPGGMTLAAIELPRGSYPGTDFSSAFLNVSVHPKLTAEQCTQFMLPNPSSPQDGPFSASKVRIGATEFDAMPYVMKQAHAKYYHVFQDAVCYEFALGMRTARDKATEGSIPVNSEDVFRKLEKVLSTVKLKSGVIPQVADRMPVPAADGSKN